MANLHNITFALIILLGSSCVAKLGPRNLKVKSKDCWSSNSVHTISTFLECIADMVGDVDHKDLEMVHKDLAGLEDKLFALLKCETDECAKPLYAELKEILERIRGKAPKFISKLQKLVQHVA